MKKTSISLPINAREYLMAVLWGRRACVPVMMQDGRLLKLTYELMPLYDDKGNPLPELDLTSPPPRRKVSPPSPESRTAKTPARRSPR